MKSKINNYLYNETNKDYLLEYKSSLREYINDHNFQNELDAILKDRNYSVLSLLCLFYNYFKKHMDISQDDFLKETFNWVSNLSYKHKFTNDFSKELIPLYMFFVNFIRFVCFDMSLLNNDFINEYPPSFLTDSEEKNENFISEYGVFKKSFKDFYIFEMMLLDMAITGHNTLEHVIGVNHLSMYIARQLYNLNLPVDLGIVAGISLGHDIGKYGVSTEESKRVPYLHYYYTELWHKNLDLHRIGHIATNHSTWDLELETLPIESLILIYSDFRVKNKVEDGKYIMSIFPLDESFDVILQKLDNVDEAKENRYKRVYKKLKDFEDYMLSLGVDTTLNNASKTTTKKPFELMNKQETIDNLKFLSIEHNIDLMAKLTDRSSFSSIIENARGEKDWIKLRLYLQIFREYSTYLTQDQKIITLHLLSDLLLHGEEDIRKDVSELIGKLIALFDEEYRKELPKSVNLIKNQKSSESVLDEFLEYLLYPNHKIVESQREWLYNLKNLIKSLFREAHSSNHRKYFDILNKYYLNCDDLSDIANFYLSQTIDYIPINSLDEDRLLSLFTYTIKQLDSYNLEIRLTTLDSISQMLVKTQNPIFISSIRNWLTVNLDKSNHSSENYLKYIIAKKINIAPLYLTILEKNFNEHDISDIFFENLKTATEWVKKKINIDMLYDQVIKNPSGKGLHIAMHLCNILKVSAVERVRNYSGITLLNIFDLLSFEERNDVAIELLRALEMDSYQFAKFIPKYLGELLLFLPPKELDEIISDFEMKIKKYSVQASFLLLNTVGICTENYRFYKNRFTEDEDLYSQRLNRLLGIFLTGMASYENDIRRESIRVLGSTVFNSKSLSLDEKYNIFNRISKKILTLIDNDRKNIFLFYNNASSLNHIYRFISSYEFYKGFIDINNKFNIAFFPGSFDPFSLGHKEIAIEISNLGFQVFLAVDEFSWSKRTEPHEFRRNIINMSVSNEQNIYLFPKNIPINISNENDLNKLKALFPQSEVYIVVGSDVLINASAYKKESPILDFNHIVFNRKSLTSTDEDEVILEKNISNIRSNVIRLSLPPQYEDISSSQIRQNIDLNRDIAKYIDPLAESYIYDYGLYSREPQYKSVFESKTIDVEVLRNLSLEMESELKNQFGKYINLNHLTDLKRKINYSLLLLKNAVTGEILGFSTFYWVRQNMLYDEFEDSTITDYIRNNVQGRILILSGIIVKDNDKKLYETVLNETLAISVTRDYNYALYNNLLTKKRNVSLEEQLILQGFILTGFMNSKGPILVTNMNNPITLNLDLENMLKPPYNTDKKILEAIELSRDRLKESISKLYPGNIVITFNRDMIYSKLIQKICDTNHVDIVPYEVRNLGESMCVPFGLILNNTIIPNTVTKTLHTEKVFKPDIIKFDIKEFPNYLSLENQAKILKSFNRPVILVDDLLNKAYRLNVVEPLLREQGITIKKIIVGILTGRGKEFGDINNVVLDYAYFIPNLKLWFNESSQYPFIGGDMVDNEKENSFSIPSINMILPYVSPRFIKNVSKNSIYNLSEVCLENSYSIFEAIEEVYQELNKKSLTLKSLGEVITYPRHPDTVKNIKLNKHLKPTSFIEMDLEYLRRLENIITR